MTINPCLVIPVYNHGALLAKSIPALVGTGLPCIFVDDGSRDQTPELLDSFADAHASIRVVHREANGGKGAAAKTGFREAARLGYTHAVQVDADGQHDLSDLGRFLDAADRYPRALILGKPVYDASVPRVRFYCRYLTHVLVWIECLSTAIKDSMCGFRVYPLAEVAALLDRSRVGDRMDFDTEIAVKLYWAGVPVIHIDTKVSYHEDGISHFRMVKDNALMTGLHIRLVCGMLPRALGLIARHLKRN